MSENDDRFTAFMKRRWNDETGGQGGRCDETCKRYQLCNLSFSSSLAEFLACTYHGYSGTRKEENYGPGAEIASPPSLNQSDVNKLPPISIDTIP